MKLIKKILLVAGALAAVLYLAFCSFLYFNQENFLFHAEKLPINYKFQFGENVEEMFIEATDGNKLNGLLFSADSSKGLIFYLHGNAGTLKSWGDVAENFTQHQYDVFILDYRGFGKSGGTIESEKQFFADAQAAYDVLKSQYKESSITILGYSIGTGVATYLASKNTPRQLILQAPFYNMGEMAIKAYPFVPSFLLKYKFETNKYIKDVKAPIVLLHGNADKVISYDCSIRLKECAKPGDKLIKLTGLGHNGWSQTEEYQNALKEILR